MTSKENALRGLFIALTMVLSGCQSPSGYRFTSVPDCTVLELGDLFCIDEARGEYTIPSGSYAGHSCVSPLDRAILANERDELAAKYIKCRKSRRNCK